MVSLVLVGVVVLVLVLWAADRLYKAHVQARRRRMMTTRLTAATERADQQQSERQAAAAAGAELTSFMPAIRHPGLTVPGVPPHSPRARVGRERPAQRERAAAREHGPGRENRRPARTGEHPARPAAEHPAQPGGLSRD